MHFGHSAEIWHDYPELVPGALLAEGLTKAGSVEAETQKFYAIAERRLAERAEAELPEVQAWRRVFSRMGLKPTQYRCASEALLRRFRKEKSLPRLHPVLDLCNAISLAYAIPVAVFDAACITDYLEVRYATGSEQYLTFAGEIEHPEAHEVIFADGEQRAHARRWTHRQSGVSAVRDGTETVLIVAEGVHQSAPTDVRNLMTAVSESYQRVWSIASRSVVLDRSAPRFEF